MLEAITARQIAWVNRITAGLGARDLQHALATLRHLRSALEQLAADDARKRKRASHGLRRRASRSTTQKGK